MLSDCGSRDPQRLSNATLGQFLHKQEDDGGALHMGKLTKYPREPRVDIGQMI
jgi:hypothetical protein